MRFSGFGCLFLFFRFPFAFCDLNGICLNTTKIKKTRYDWDVSSRRWVQEAYLEPKPERICCDGYNATSLVPLKCDPVCDPGCVNADCEAPGMCICKPGHVIVNDSNSTCYEICDSCSNGACLSGSSECTCDEGYKKDPKFIHICNPICSPECENSNCKEPNKCECIDMFKKDPNKENVCVPICSNTCVFGRCSAPDECTCFEGYLNDAQSPHVCVPECEHDCENGFCEHPNSCRCLDGFEKHPRNPFKCYPHQPENLTLSFCEFELSKAIKYSDVEDCYEMKENIALHNSSGCQLLDILSQPTCTETNKCVQNEHVLNFLCSAKTIKKSKEIHCDLGFGHSETDHSSNSSITYSKDWLDFVLVLNSFQQNNFSAENSTHYKTQELTIQPLTKGGVCGQNTFSLQVSSGGSFASPQVGILLKSSSTAIWITVTTISCLLLICIGVGISFYIYRTRRGNNPLNYQTSRGCINKGCDDEPEELLPMEIENVDF